ncbi:MAG: hypothetical protein ACRAVC_21445 [Trichormus sp.]
MESELGQGSRGAGSRGAGSRGSRGSRGRKIQCPMPHAQCPMPIKQLAKFCIFFITIRWKTLRISVYCRQMVID